MMLDSKHRAAMSLFLSGKKDRGDMDSPVGSAQILFEALTMDFNDSGCIVKMPREEWHDRLDDRANWDPNNINVTSKNRSVQWAWKLWDFLRKS